MPHILILTCDQDTDWMEVSVHPSLQAVLDFIPVYLESELAGQEPYGSERSKLIDRILVGIQESHDFELYGFRYRIFTKVEGE